MERTWTYVDGAWRAGNTPLMGAETQAAWLAQTVFDGARAFAGVTPDLDRHCERVIRSARYMGLRPAITAGEIEELAREGVTRFPQGAELYIRPMFWAEVGIMAFDPDKTRFALVIQEIPMPSDAGFTACMSRFRRPGPDQAPTKAKAACLYPIATLALQEARARGFGGAVMCDPIGKVAEFTGSNIFLVKDGVVHTPVPNDTFLNGITRQRVLNLLDGAGIAVLERAIDPAELDEADEIFSTGNYGKVLPVIGYEQRALQPGPVYRKARQLYWDWALAGR